MPHHEEAIPCLEQEKIAMRIVRFPDHHRQPEMPMSGRYRIDTMKIGGAPIVIESLRTHQGACRHLVMETGLDLP